MLKFVGFNSVGLLTLALCTNACFSEWAELSQDRLDKLQVGVPIIWTYGKCCVKSKYVPCSEDNQFKCLPGNQTIICNQGSTADGKCNDPTCPASGVQCGVESTTTEYAVDTCTATGAIGSGGCPGTDQRCIHDILPRTDPLAHKVFVKRCASGSSMCDNQSNPTCN